MKKSGILILLLGLFITGCFTPGDNPVEPGSPELIQIISPVSGQIIYTGGVLIEYNILDKISLRFIELYVNGSFVRNFPPTPNGSFPDVIINLDSSRIGEIISLYLICYDNNGSSSKSNEIKNLTVEKRTTPPLSPGDLSVLILSPASVSLNWTPRSDGVDEYEVFRKSGYTGNYELIRSWPGFTTNIIDEISGLDIPHFYKIRAKNSFGYSDFSKEISLSDTGGTGGIIPPSQLSTIARGNKLVRLEWQDNSDNEETFIIERRTIFGEFSRIGTVSAGVNSYADSGNTLQPGTVYIYRVKSVNSTDTSWSNLNAALTYPFDVKPPKNLTAGFSGGNKVLLNWSDENTLFTSTEVERKKGESGTYSMVNSVLRTSTSYVDSITTGSGIYFYRIRSVLDSYVSDYTSEVSVIIP